MTSRPQPLPPVPEGTVAALQAAFPKGNPDVARALSAAPSTTISSLPTYIRPRRPVEVAPWRLALIMVMHYITTHHISYKVAALAGIVSLYLSVLALPISRGIAGQRTDIPEPSLIEGLKQKDHRVQEAAAEALAQMRPEAKTAVRDLIEVLRQGATARVQEAAAEALGQMGPEAKTALPTLIEAVQQDGIRRHAAGALATIALALQGAGAAEMIDSLKRVHTVLVAYPNTSKEAETVKRAVNGLEDHWWIQLQKRLWQWVGNYPLLSAIPVAYLTLLLC